MSLFPPSDLSPDQQRIVDNPDGARVILSGPGSGKTKTMVALYHSLVESGVPANNIRCVTFSREAAATIEKRVGIKGLFSTFHSLGYEICSEFERKPVEPELRHRLMMNLIRRWGLEYKELDQFISRMRHANVSPESVMELEDEPYSCRRAYAEYESKRLAGGWVDFTSMLCDAVQILEIAQNRARWQFQYILVDESQDTDSLQFRMLQLLSEKHGNITVVGDPSQSIYVWRGARPENLTNFTKWFPEGRCHYLGRNYRSTQRLVSFIRENAPSDCPKELLEKMVPAREDLGKPIGLKMYFSEDDESEVALKLAQQDPLNSIVLARTNRMLGSLERLCNRHNIRYHLLGKSGFWKQSEIGRAVESLKAFPELSTEAAMAMALPTLKSKYAVDDRTERDNDALENLAVLQTISKDFPRNSEFVVYANKMIHRRNSPKGLTLSTVHQAKGGEWKNVYLVGARNGVMPHKKGDPLEEERIWFVAISRAVDYLRISFSGTPSPYLDKYLTPEIRDKLMESANEVERLQNQIGLFKEA